MTAPESITDVMSGSPYRDYLYSYPHKSAYRPLTPSHSLSELWANEDQQALFLYMHIPFCEMRCGFCNLFTTPKPAADPVADYVDALERQAAVVKGCLDEPRFARMAIGGGTPTYLSESQLHRVFDVAERTMGVDLSATPISVETSPETGSQERLAALRSRGVDRISIGVQSFDEREVRGVGRAQETVQVEKTLTMIRELGFPTLNIDLMYGLPGQTPESWLASLERTMYFAAQEVYIYPLYVRPLTGLGRQQKSWDDERLDFYQQGRDFLLERGYEQVSMRMFRKKDAPEVGGPVYCCQSDGMVGLGVGARSYTDRLHYSSEYAVGNRGVKDIIGDFTGSELERYRHATYGVQLDDDDRRRRFVIVSLLANEGLGIEAYRERFDSEVIEDFGELSDLVEAGAATHDSGRIMLTPAGMERSDAIGPWLRSAQVNALMESYALR
jgi:oxygen-independent coproporphyrinogen-3 oxidase